MEERFLVIKEAMKEALRGGIFCGGCSELITGPKVTVIRTSVPRSGELPVVEVSFNHESCNKGGVLNE